MKNLFLLILFILNQISNAQDIAYIGNINKDSSFENKSYQYVYICTGQYAYAYHSYSNCTGLNNCKGQIIYVDINVAKNNYNRVPCCRCWSNVNNRCQEDNPNHSENRSGSGSNNAASYAVLAIIMLSVVILSNDVYLGPSYSFYKFKIQDNSSIKKSVGLGYTIQLRKTFKQCAIEYGGSWIRYKQTIIDNYSQNTYYQKSKEIWSVHLGFIHNIFYKKLPSRLSIYIGPTVMYLKDFGYGGTIGLSLKLIERLKLDLRYQLTTQSNQLTLGLNFTYQKKYFWKK